METSSNELVIKDEDPLELLFGPSDNVPRYNGTDASAITIAEKSQLSTNDRKDSF